MSATMQNLVGAINELKEKFPDENISAIEFGTIPVVDASSEGQSTFLLSNALGKKGSLISVDHDEKSIVASQTVCQGKNNIVWVKSDSVEYLKNSNNIFHFVFLDSHPCKDVTFREFCLAAPKMVIDGILMIDDAGITKDGLAIDNTGCTKAHKVWEFLKEIDADFSLLEYPNFLDGTQMRVVFDEINTTKIINALKEIEQ